MATSFFSFLANTGPAPTRQAPQGSGIGPVQGATGRDAEPNKPGYSAPNEIWIRGAIRINPSWAAYYYSGRHPAEFPVPGDNEPQEVRDRVVSQALASANSPNAWERKPSPASSDGVRYGSNPPQA